MTLSLPVKLAIGLFFLVAVLLPLARMLAYMGGTDVMGVLAANNTRRACLNSLKVGLLTTVIALPLAYALAWCVTRTRVPGKGLWGVLFTLPILIPSISQGSGLIILFGANGILTRALHLPGNIYGLHGIVIGEIMYVTPIVFLMLADVLTYEDYTPYEAAQVLGIPRRARFTAVTLPFLRRTLVSAVFTAFSLSVTDYGVPLTIGGKVKTLPVLMYEDVVGLVDFGKGSVIGAILLIPAVLAFLADFLAREQSGGFVTADFPLEKNRKKEGAALVLCGAVGLFMLLPVAAFGVLMCMTNYPIDMTFTLDNITKTLRMEGGTYLLNSLAISVGVGVIGVVVGTASAYCTTRMRSPVSRVLHLFSIVTMAIPGLVLGLAYVLFFKTTVIYGTLAILILANMMHFFASPYLMFYNTFGKLNENLEAVGLTLGVSRLRIIRDVVLPQCRGTMLEAFSYFFVNSMITISAVSFLANSSTRPVALLIPIYEAQSFLECSAFVSIAILACNLVVKAAVALLKGALRRAEG
ncbi:MAG: ABC transporter permease subunit [Ruminiclostridium sp.]|nr:ABC transporter permease subunit [Ruminiclostridium sp.]